MRLSSPQLPFPPPSSACSPFRARLDENPLCTVPILSCWLATRELFWMSVFGPLACIFPRLLIKHLKIIHKGTALKTNFHFLLSQIAVVMFQEVPLWSAGAPQGEFHGFPLPGHLPRALLRSVSGPNLFFPSTFFLSSLFCFIIKDSNQHIHTVETHFLEVTSVHSLCSFIY